MFEITLPCIERKFTNKVNKAKPPPKCTVKLDFNLNKMTRHTLALVFALNKFQLDQKYNN